MKVKELIVHLKTLDPEMDVIVESRDFMGGSDYDLATGFKEIAVVRSIGEGYTTEYKIDERLKGTFLEDQYLASYHPCIVNKIKWACGNDIELRPETVSKAYILK